MQYIKHPLIKPNAIEAREFQINIARLAVERSTMVVIPTGMGKTFIALMVIAEVLYRKGPMVLLLAPTKPLVEQHSQTLRRFLLTSPIGTFTGEISPNERKEKYSSCPVIVSTPQVIYNDLLSERFTLKNVNLIIFDEAHRAIGNYAYVPISRRYLLERPDALSMGLTASPGWDEKKILQVCTNLGIENVEIRTPSDRDVAPYINEVEISWVKVDIPPGLKVIKKLLEELLRESTVKLAQMGLIYNPNRITTKELIEVGKRVRKKIATSGRGSSSYMYHAITLQAKALKISHALEMAETQGLKELFQYLDRLVEESYSSSASRASKSIIKSERFRKVYNLSEAMKEMDHPKVNAAVNVIREQIKKDPDSRIILFAHYRDTATVLYEKLFSLKDTKIRPVRFVGQASRKGDKGLNQKEQKDIIDKFREGEFNVLIATSVAEEGLDIPSTDLVVFYEPVPSEIRTIQRRGRTGRTHMGKVVILITKETRDVAYFFSSIKKEKKMEGYLKRLRTSLKQMRLSQDDGGKDLFLLGEESGGVKESAKPIMKGKTIIDLKEGAGQLTLTEFEKTENDIKKKEGKKKRAMVDEKNAPPVIWTDHREIGSIVAQYLREMGVSPVPTTLPQGDFLISTEVGVERKAADDFARSIIDGRLFKQIKEMKKHFLKPIIIVEGEIKEIDSGVRPEAVWGAISSLIVDLGVPVIRSASSFETARFLAATVKKVKKGNPSPPPLRRKKGGMTIDEQKRYVVQGLPFVSSSTAERLLEKFGTIKGVFSADVEDLMKVKGIGKKKAEELYRLINS